MLMIYDSCARREMITNIKTSLRFRRCERRLVLGISFRMMAVTVASECKHTISSFYYHLDLLLLLRICFAHDDIVCSLNEEIYGADVWVSG